MPTKIFLTGFPGFIARNLVGELRRRDPGAELLLLVEPRLLAPAADAASSLGGKTRLLSGDLTRPRLGMDDADYDYAIRESTHLWHLAAVYDLSVPLARAYRVNVVGTATLLDFAEACRHLERLDYVSTCYVCGTRTGLVREAELDEGQDFNNYYEATKCWAEIEVRRRMARIPTTIYRPSIVVGDSRTGATEKYDGPYYIIRFLLRLPRWLPLAQVGQGRAPANLVPIDFVVAAMAEIWTKPDSLGLTVQLADPAPHTSGEVLDELIKRIGRRRPMLTLPPSLVRSALAVPGIRSFLRLPAETIAYLNHDVRFDTGNQLQLLSGTGVRCPDLLSILPALLDYLRQNPEKPFLDGRAL